MKRAHGNRSARRAWLRVVVSGLSLIGALGAAQAEEIQLDVSFPGLQIERGAAGETTVLHLPGGEVQVPLGQPQVPSVELILEVPEGTTVLHAELTSLAERSFELAAPVAPYEGERAVDIEERGRPTIEPVPYTEAEAFFPPAWVEVISLVTLTDGSRHAVLRLNPLRLWPVTGRLLWVREARLTVTLAPEETHPTRLPRLRAATGPAADARPGGVWLATPGLQFAPRPATEGTPVEYAIISPPDPAMVAAWEQLADWKTSVGIPAQVFTTEWIEAQYPTGADQAERIRMFLQDAYAHWGLRWALLGGDTDAIQVRYALSMSYGANGTFIASDYYYACLEGNWDADGDGVFGESSRAGTPDWADTTPEIHVGRVSARSAGEVNDFLAKYFAYATTPPLDGYLDRGMLLGEVLFHAEWQLNGLGDRPDCHEEEFNEDYCRRDKGGNVIYAYFDGAEDCFEIAEILGDTLGLPLEPVFLIERAERWMDETPGLEAIVESSANVLQYINAGHGFVHQTGHGDRDRWAIGTGRLLTGDLASLTNGTEDHYFWAYASNCHSAAVDYDCIGERMVGMADHGAVAYIGCTNADFPSTARKFVRDFYKFGFGADGRTIGDAFYGSLGAHALTGQYANSEGGNTRFLLYGQLLIGEPGMALWRATPSVATVALADYPDGQVPIGASPLRIAVTGDGGPVAGARVCVQKSGEVYVVGETDASGEIEVPFWPETEGAFSVSAAAPGYLPASYDAGEVVAPNSGAAVTVAEVAIVDDGTAGSRGNGNGQIEIGETVRLVLELANLGDAAAVDVTAELGWDDELPAGTLALIDSTASFASIPADAQPVADEEAFLFTVTGAPAQEVFGEADLARVAATVAIELPGRAASGFELKLELTRPRLAIATTHSESGGGNARTLWFALENRGRGAASHLVATLESFNTGQISIVGGNPLSLAGPEVAPGDTARFGPFPVHVQDELGRLSFTVVDTFLEPDATVHTRTFDLGGPEAPEITSMVGLYRAMRLEWERPNDPGGDGILGYKVYRADDGGEEFAEVMTGVLEGHSFVQDGGLEVMAPYSYQVAAVDSGGNLGARSAIVSGYTSPGTSPGWPNTLENFTKCSPLICELDGWVSSGWGREVVFGGETIYAFHATGDEVIDGDQLERTRGPFSAPGTGHVGDEFWGKPAAGDVDNDGDVELLAIAFNHTNDLVQYPNARGELVCWGQWGRSPEWVFTMPQGIAWNSPTLADLDQDGRLDIILFCLSGGLHALNGDGTAWEYADSTTALLADLNAHNLYQTPSVGDVDGDDLLDIVVASRTSPPEDGALHVLDSRGIYKPGFGGSNGEGIRFADLPPGVGESTTAAVTLCNVDGTKGDEIFVVTTRHLYCFTRNGALTWWFEFPVGFTASHELYPEAALGDVDLDGKVDVAIVDHSGAVRLFDAATGQQIAPFPIQLEQGLYYGSVILANVNDDPNPEIIFGDNQQRIHAYTHEGVAARGFPITFGGSFARQSVAAWDVDGDGFQNLVVQADKTQRITVYDVDGATFPTDEGEQARQNPWPMRFRDPLNSGRYTTTPPVAVGVLAEAPRVSETGEVTLQWTSADPAAAFRIRRARDEHQPALLIGEVPGRADPGTQRYTYRDRPPEAGAYVYWINPVSLGGGEEPGPTVTVFLGEAAEVVFGFERIAPEPMRAGRPTRIGFGLAGGSSAERATRLQVFDLQGRLVRTLLDEPRAGGRHEVEWAGRDAAGRPLGTGLYLLRLESGARRAVQRILLVR